MDAKKIILLVFAVIGLSVAASALTWIFLGSTAGDDKEQPDTVKTGPIDEATPQPSPSASEPPKVDGATKPVIDPKAAINDANREAGSGSKPVAKPAPKLTPAPAPAPARPATTAPKPAQGAVSPTPAAGKPAENPVGTVPTIKPESFIPPAPKPNQVGA